MPVRVSPELQRVANWRAALAFFDALAGCGLRHVCISPGSRSTPLAVCASLLAGDGRGASLLRDGALRTWVHLDERAAAFFALGIAKARREPVALVCTSGTAAANYLPAIVEARYAAVPLVVLTADRPPELRDRGAGQTIEQAGLYGRNVRWFHEVAVPEPTLSELGGPGLAHVRSLAARAVTESLARPRGAVHLNWPLREPLDPPESLDALVAELGDAGRARAVAAGKPGRVMPASEEVAALAERIVAHERGVIACGPNDEGDGFGQAALQLAARAGWPLLAEPTSGTRGGGGPVVARSELVLRHERFAVTHRPEVVLRLGRSPTSKAQRQWLAARPPGELWLVDPDRAWNDPDGLATRWLDAEPATLCRAVCEQLGSSAGREGGWLRDFAAADAAASAAVEQVVAGTDGLLAPGVIRELASALPADAWLYVSNSMAVRDIDAFWPMEVRPRRVLSNRGASGIDGVTSSALGAAAVCGAPLVLLTGDLAFLHDVGGLLTGRQVDLAATVVVLDDDGGGIFSHLPIAAHGEAVGFERLFRTPQGVDLTAVARSLGASAVRVEDAPGLRAALSESVGKPGLSIVSVAIDAAANLAQHRAIDAAVERELAALSFEAGSA